MKRKTPTKTRPPRAADSFPSASVNLPSAAERLLRVPADKLGLLAHCVAKVCSAPVLEAILEELEAKEQRRSLTSQLPDELSCNVLEFVMRTSKEVGPMARVCKAFGQYVKLPQMLERVTLRVPFKMLKNVSWEDGFGNEDLDEDGMTEKRAKLEAYLHHASEQYPGLGRLQIESNLEQGTSVVQNDTIGAVASNFPALNTLHLCSNRQVSDLSPLSSLSSLKELALVNCKAITDAEFSSLSTLTSLQDLNVRVTSIGDAGVRAISSLPSLISITLASCSSITDAGFTSLSSLKSLRYLDVAGTRIGNTGVGAISSILSLTKLNLHCCTLATDAGFSSLSALTSLNYLDVGRTNCGDAGVRAISAVTSLRKLFLNRCKSVTDSGFRSMLSLTSLVFLGLMGTSIGDDASRALESMPSMIRYIGRSQIRIHTGRLPRR